MTPTQTLTLIAEEIEAGAEALFGEVKADLSWRAIAEAHRDMWRQRAAAVLVAAGAVRKTSGWQPIETAPKDGSRFLACDPDGSVSFFHWQDLQRPGAPVGWRNSFITVFPEGSPGAPSRWMPLPLKPAVLTEPTP